MKVKMIDSMNWACSLKAVTSPTIEKKGVKRNTHTNIREIVPTFLKKGPIDCILLARANKRRNTDITPIIPARCTNIILYSYPFTL